MGENMNYYIMRLSLLRISLIILLFIPVKSFAQNNFALTDWSADRSLYNFLLEKAHQQYDQRRVILNKAINSPSSAIGYTHKVRSKLLNLLGTMPPLSPLNANVTATIKYDSYVVQKLVYESFPQHHVTANLYLPVQKGKRPAILFLCGHEDEAKATESYQRTAILFAKNGFVVLVIDPLSQGERLQLTSAAENALGRVGKKEHTLLNESSNLVGSSLAAYQVWDAKRGLDYLTTLSVVDTTKIGCIGNSGGGMQAIYFTGYDKRVKCAAICSYLSSRERMYDLEGPTDGCVELPNEGKELMEMSDYLAAAAPTPLLILAGRFDGIDYIGTKKAEGDLTHLYTAMGKQENIRLFTYDDGHGISKPKREEAVRWFSRWLCNKEVSIQEDSCEILPAKSLWATTTGQINTDYPDEVTVASRNRALFDSMAELRKKFLQNEPREVIKDIAELMKLKFIGNSINIEHLPAITKHRLQYGAAIIRSDGNIPIPLLFLRPAKEAKKIVIWLCEDGKARIADSVNLLSQYLEEGAFVVLADIRGVGETADKPELNELRYSNKEYRNTALSLHIGDPLPVQRITDIFNLLQFIQSDSSLQNVPIYLNADGVLGVPALYATLFSNVFRELHLFNTIRSYRDILEQPLGKNWYSYFIPGVLKYYDLPDIITLIKETKNTQVFFKDIPE